MTVFRASYLSIRAAAIKSSGQLLSHDCSCSYALPALLWSRAQADEWVLQDLTAFHTRVSLPPDKIEIRLSSAFCFASEYLGHLNFAINLQEQDPGSFLTDPLEELEWGTANGQKHTKRDITAVSLGRAWDTILDLFLRDLLYSKSSIGSVLQISITLGFHKCFLLWLKAHCRTLGYNNN